MFRTERSGKRQKAKGQGLDSRVPGTAWKARTTRRNQGTYVADGAERGGGLKLREEGRGKKGSMCSRKLGKAS